MKDAYSTPLVQIRLILDGAIRLFENEGQSIRAVVRDEERDGLLTALDSMGEALCWAREITHDALLHGIGNRHAPSID